METAKNLDHSTEREYNWDAVLKIKSEAMGDIGHMFMLAEKFMKPLKEIGLSHLDQPIFYHAPVGLRFEIGGGGGGYQKKFANPKKIRHALYRGWTNYKKMPSVPDIF